MRYISTRGEAEAVSAGQAILKGLADDGGLYVPEQIPTFSKPLSAYIPLPYPSLAYEILSSYLTDYPEAELRACVDKAYAYPDNFDDPLVAPLRKTDGIYYLELFHGRTLAFKDMALSLLPHLLTAAAARYRPGEKTVVLTATSGDTGKAALEGFKEVDGVSVAVFYPEDGVSTMQKRQMITQEGSNTYVFGVRGNFDDAQSGVKKIFNNKALAAQMLEKGLVFSSANSINIGRLLPQIVYYVYAYAQMVRQGGIKTGDPVDFTVPTGNFGNILAGYYARQMGLPIRRLICASNNNHVLYDFFRTGLYDINRAFYTTLSPSMDILVSSNLERLLYHTAQDAALVAQRMTELSRDGRYQFDLDLPYFYAAYANEDETRDALRDTARQGYVTDPHTAVAYHAYQRYKAEAGDDTPSIIIATASPFKFSANVYAAITGKSSDWLQKSNIGSQSEDKLEDEDSAMDKLSRLSGQPVPNALQSLAYKPVRHTTVCPVTEMEQTLINTVIFPQAQPYIV